MRIANPIYDAVFKYLLEDIDIAKGIIGRIIGEEIVELHFQPEEVKIKNKRYLVIILRVDFKAIIKTQTGKHKKVLIEIQKGKEGDDIVRFRKYLSENYKGKDSIVGKEGQKEQVLPVIPIYFLGFPLKQIKTPALRVGRSYFDLINNRKVNAKNEFIERLTHDGYFIQIGKLGQIDPKTANELERILYVFNQSYRLTSDSRLLEISAEEIENDSLLKKVITRLRHAATDSDLLKRIEIEEEFEKRLEKQIRKVANLEDEVEKLKQEKIAAAKSLVANTELTDEQIATIQNLTVEEVNSLRVEND